MWHRYCRSWRETVAWRGLAPWDWCGLYLFWRGLPEDSDRILRRLRYQVHNPALVPQIFLQHLNERLMSLCSPLASKRHATFISAYTPTLTSAEGVKNAFYDELTCCIRSKPTADKMFLFGDFNARTGNNKLFGVTSLANLESQASV